MFTIEERQEAADRLAQLEDCPFCNVLYEGEGKKIVVLPRFRGSKERGLAYLVQEVDADATTYDVFGSTILYIDDLHTGHSSALEEYKAVDVPIIARRWKEEREARERKEAREREEARKAIEEAERTRFHGFTDSMTPMQRGRVVKCLDTKMRYTPNAYVKGGIMTRAKWIEAMAEVGGRGEIATYKGRTERRIYCRDNGFYVVTKTEYDYFKFMEKVNIPF